MSERIDLDAPETTATQEMARPHEWNGQLLQPFSAGRHAALQRLRVLGEGSETETAAALVRLCLMDSRAVGVLRGEERIAEFHEQLSDWMEKQGVGLGPKRKAKTTALIDLYAAILAELYDAENLAPVKEGTPRPGNE